MAAKKAAGIGKFFGQAPSTPSKEKQEEGMTVELTKGEAIDRNGVDGEDHSKSVEMDAMVQALGEAKAEMNGVKVEGVGVKNEAVKRERDESSVSAVLRTPEKKAKLEVGFGRSLSPASGGSVVKKEGLPKSRQSLTSFFSKRE